MKTVIVIPTYNELENVGILVDRLTTLPVPVDLFFIDDNSSDGTGDFLETLRLKYPCLRVMHRPQKTGLGSAYREAYRQLLCDSYELFIAMDADLSHQPEAIPDLVRASMEADLVIGSRYCSGGRTKNWPLSRRLLSRTANQLAKNILGLTVEDSTAGFRCYRRGLLAALDHWDVQSEGYAYQIEMTYLAQLLGFRVREVPIVFEDRLYATSKLCSSEITSAMKTLMRLRHHRTSRIGADVSDETFCSKDGP